MWRIYAAFPVVLWIFFLIAAKADIYQTGDRELKTKTDCKALKVFRNATTINWKGVELKTCSITIWSQKVGDKICWEMKSLKVNNKNNYVKFKGLLRDIQVWNSKHANPSRNCTTTVFPKLVVNTEKSPGESFTLQIYSKEKGFSWDTSNALTNEGTIFIIVGCVALMRIF